MFNRQGEWDYFWAAVMFYTRIPVPSSASFSDQILNQSRKYFPLIGLFVGSFACLVLLITHKFLPLSVCIGLSIVVTILLTGSFHEDGFADCCDGFGGGWDKAQVLSIMKDSRVGTYAVVGLVLLIGLKALSLYEIGLLSLPLLLITYINGHALSRFGASLCIECLDYVQDIDKSKVKPITLNRLPMRSLIYSGFFIAPTFLILLHFKLIFI